jgi:hypothetical protein
MTTYQDAQRRAADFEGFNISRPTQVERPGFLPTLSASFNLENTVVSAINNDSLGASNAPVQGYDPWKDFQESGLDQEYWERLSEAQNPDYFSLVSQRIKQEQEWRRTREMAGWTGVATDLIAAIVDLPTLIPGGALVRGTKLGFSVGRSALSVGAASAVGAGAAEAALHATQETRTGTESALNVGGAVILGSLIGGAAAKALSPGERRAAETALGRIISEGADDAPMFDTLKSDIQARAAQPLEGEIGPPIPDQATAAGADVARGARLSAGQTAPAGGKLVEGIINASSPMTPNLRALRRISPVYRKQQRRMTESNVILKAHEEGIGLGPAIDRQLKMIVDPKLAKAISMHTDIYKEMRKSGIKMSREEFERRVGRSMRRSEIDHGHGGERNLFIERAAKVWHDELFIPIFREGQKVIDGKTKEPIFGTGKASEEYLRQYLTRMYNRPAVVAKQFEIRDTIRPYIRSEAEKAIDEFERNYISELDDLKRQIDSAETPELKEKAIEKRGVAIEKYTKAKEDKFKNMDIDEYTDEVIDHVMDTLMGRKEIDPSLPPGVMRGHKGPLKERNIPVPDQVWDSLGIDGRGVLEDNVVEIARNYSRIAGAQIGLAKTFGETDASTAMKEILDDYKRLERAVNAATTREELDKVFATAIDKTDGEGKVTIEIRKRKIPGVRRADSLERAKEKALVFLQKDREDAMNDFKDTRDLILGTSQLYGLDNTWGKISRRVRAYNSIRLMGGATLASLPEVFRPGMVHGMLPYIGMQLQSLSSSAGRAARMAAKTELNLGGSALETALQHRVMSLAEITDPYRRETGIDRFLDNMTRVAFKWNGLTLFTEATQHWSGIMSMNNIIDSTFSINGGKISRAKHKKLMTRLAALDIDESQIPTLARFFEKHAKKENGIWVANTDKWGVNDGMKPELAERAKEIFRAAFSKDIDSMITQRSFGNVPLFVNTPLGSVMMQFKSFFIASHEKVLIRGMQEDRTNFISGLLAMSVMGMAATYMRAYYGGQDRVDALSNNPGFWVGESLDMTGIFSIPFEVANTTEKLVRINPLKDPLRAAFPDTDQQAQSQRYINRSPWEVVLGPTGTLPTLMVDIMRITGDNFEEGADEEDVQSLIRKTSQAVPFYSYPGMRQMFQYLYDDLPGEE